jgi:uncharacterized protein YuzE
MKFIYDAQADALTIILAEGRAVERTEELEIGTLVDVDRRGNPVAIEILRPAREWPIADITARFRLDSATQEGLRSLRQQHQYPYERPIEKGAAPSAEVVVS